MHAGDATDFDPYYKWLGIPASEQPPNHYRLLGIELFEEDLDVISAAADRQMGHVKAFATGPYGAHSQLLLNELSKARVSLLNPNLKPIYDQQLTKIRSARLKALAASAEQTLATQARQANQQGREVVPRPHESTTMDAVTFAAPMPIRRKRRRKSSLPLTFVTLLICVPVIAGLLWYAKKMAPVPTPLASATQDPPQPQAEEFPKPPEAQPRVEVPHAKPDPKSQALRATDQPTLPQSQNPKVNPPSLRQRLPLSVLPNQQPRPFSSRQDPTFGHNLPVGGRFASLPPIVSVSALTADEPVIGTFEPPIDRLRLLEVHLMAPSYLERANRVLFLHRHRDTDEEIRWLVFDEPTSVARAIATSGDTGDALPFAMLRATKNEFSFAWLDQAGREQSTERLENCLLRIVADQEVHHLQLRSLVEEEPHVTLGNWEEVFEFQLPVESIPNLPPASELMLRITAEEGFPATSVVNGQPERLAAGEQLLLSFRSSDYAGLGTYWEQKGKMVSVHVSPGFRLQSYPDDLFILSRTEVEKVEKRLERDKREAAKEYSRRVRKRALLNRNLDAANRINIQLPGGGTTVQLRNQKQAAVAAAQADVNTNEARITALGRLAPLVEQDQSSRIPALRSLATELEGRAQVGFELYMPVGGEEIVLYRKGGAKADANVNTLGL
jgi:hypothetical protein